ncbi:DNA repair protein Rev1 [Epargyreus clarus]|uniref:DNA repair protein Rev1 n=1 Tax=Epargyreus clarus TaxID=520877 RepID=UPI003C2D2A66
MQRKGDFPDNGFEAWGGYMQAKIAKLEEQFSSRKDEPKLSNIFSGVSIYVNGFTNPSADELKELMSRHGGVYHTYQRSDDFIIASNLPDTKVKNMSLVKVVKPEWITDSISSNRLLDYRDYLLYRNSRTQPRLHFNTVNKSENSTVNETKCQDLNIKNEGLNNSSPILVKGKVSPTLKIDTDVSFSDNNCQLPYNNSEVLSKIENSHSRLDDVKKSDHSVKTAVDPNFISEFYNNSRLHHISQLGACFKQHINELRESSNFKFPAREHLREKILDLNTVRNLNQLKFERGKTIMHIDMDCFFVSVGLRKRPELRGKPVAVTHSKGGQPRPKRPGVDRSTEFNLYKQKQARKIGKATGVPEDEVEFESRVDNIADEDDKYGSMSEIASCSYEARAKGIGNGMFMGAALRLCPDLQTIPYDFEGYKEVAYTLYNTIAQYTLNIEAVSCDEMYVDCTELLDNLKISASDFATALREEIKNKTGCPCSTGFGGNRLQARLATKKAKPDGQFFLTEDLVEDFIFDIKLKDLPGVGRQISQKLESLGHQTCGSLQSLTLASLKQHFGNKTGVQLFDQCRGRDLNPLSFYTVRKSVSAEVNYGIRFENNDQCIEFLKQLSAEVHSRMQQFKVLGKCITLKLMVRAEDAPVETAKFMGHGFCNIINKSTNLSCATNDADVISKEVITLCKKQNIDPKEIRGIGIQVTKLESLNSKPTKGALTKFLSNTKIVKTESKEKTDQSHTGHLPDQSKTSIPVKLRPVTPKKVKPLSPCKKSPVLGSTKSPGKKRGRPPKSSKTMKSASKNLMNKFLYGQDLVDRTECKESIVKQELYVPSKNPEVAVSVKVRQEEMPAKHIVEGRPQGLLGLPWDKVRELLMAWLDSGQVPKQCDIDLIANYMQTMVVNKNIDKVYILLNFIRRRTREINDQMWTKVYDHVSEQVQNAMLAVYGKPLYVSK